MNTALAIIRPEELDTIQRTGKLLAASSYFDGKGESAQAIAMMATKVLAGRELGIGPFASVNGIHIINGKPSIGANLLAAAVKGSERYDYRVREMSDKLCRIEFLQRAEKGWESLGVSEFSADDARRAGTKNMDKFPRNMLFARAMSNGVRFYVPDVFNGNAVYVPEELGADVDENGNVVEATYTVVEPPSGNGDAVDAPTDEESAMLNTWLSPEDAKAWAVNVGACENEFEARNSLKKIVDGVGGGRLRKENAAAIYLAFLRRQMEKLALKPGVDVADAEPLPF